MKKNLLVFGLIIILMMVQVIALSEVTITFEEPLRTNDPLLIPDVIDRQQISHEYQSIRAIDVLLTEQEIQTMKSIAGVKNIEPNHQVKLFLQTSVPLIGADQFWIKNNDSYTGENQTVCIIDTGIDYTHPTLGVDWGNKIIAGKRFLGGDIQDCQINNTACKDDHGHGTHVAGIVGGVSPGVKLIAVKVLDSAGNGYSSDVRKGIDYCLSVADEFNVTVISMSLGAPCYYEGEFTGLCFSDYCDSEQASYAGLIDEAYAKNISVVIATGNEGMVDMVSTPSCISNAYRVGSSSKVDSLSWFTNVWVKDLFLAPGQSINSTHLNGEFRVRSGTSMAAPHLAGSLALLKSFYGFNSDSFFKQLLLDEAVIIYDSGLDMNFSRINLLFNGFEPEVPEEPIIPEEPLVPEETIIIPVEEETEEIYVPKRGGGGSTDVTIFEDYSAETHLVYLGFAEVAGYVSGLKTGDLLFMGDDSVFSKYFIPKKWKHSLIYIGPEFEVRRTFGVDSDVYRFVAPFYVSGSEILVVDSNERGVGISDIRDYGFHRLTAFRPDMSRDDLAVFMLFVFDQVGKPYDFVFSFRDSAFYCSELLFKSLDRTGMDLDDYSLVVLPNSLVRDFSEDDRFEFLFYVSKEDGVFVEKSESELFDGPKFPVLVELRSLFFEKGVISIVLWILLVVMVNKYFFGSNKKNNVKRNKKFKYKSKKNNFF